MQRTNQLIAASAALLVSGLVACTSTVSHERSNEGGGGAGTGGTTTTSTATTTATGVGGTGGTGTATGTQTGGSGGCNIPAYSDDCADISYFECGFMATCEDGVIEASWHEHFEMECGEIVEFSCEHVCPYGCLGNEYPDWPADGAELVDELCAPGLSGSGGGGGAGGGAGGA